MRQTIVGFFNSASEAENAAEKLKSVGFMENDIDVSTNHAAPYTPGADTSGGTRDNLADTPYGSVSDESRYPESGNLSTSQNTLNEDRLRERRDNEGQGTGESIGRFFRRLFDNEEEAERYSTVGMKNSIVSVYAESGQQAERARDILDDCGAFDVDEKVREYGSYTDTVDRTGDSDIDRRNALGVDGISNQSIPVVEENMNIGKREVDTGGVRVRSRIVERPVEETLRLREEHVRVERVPVDRPATERDFQSFREGQIEMSETSEVPVVNKDARVTEEVRLKKDVDQRDEVIRDSVRKTDVQVENLDKEKKRDNRSDADDL